MVLRKGAKFTIRVTTAPFFDLDIACHVHEFEQLALRHRAICHDIIIIDVTKILAVFNLAILRSIAKLNVSPIFLRLRYA